MMICKNRQGNNYQYQCTPQDTANGNCYKVKLYVGDTLEVYEEGNSNNPIYIAIETNDGSIKWMNIDDGVVL